MLLLKLLLTPLMIVAVTLAGRRWGPRAAGLAAGLPVTTGPVSVFLAMERGPEFAARAAVGSVIGLIGTGTFCAAYALAARRRDWPVALAGALAALGTVLLPLRTAPLPFGATLALALAALVLLRTAVARAPVADAVAARAGSPRRPAAWDLPARMLVSAVIVAGVTGAAGFLGPRLSGVLSALPVLGGVLGTFTHHGEGRRAAVSLMRALILGCVSGVVFFAVVGAALAGGEVAVTYGAAAVAALLTSAAVSRLERVPVLAPAAAEDAPAPLPLGRTA